MEASLREAERMASIGRFAAGLAHEIGTPLNVISGRAVHHWGDALQYEMETVAGDFLFVAPDVPHYPENPYDEPVVAVVARNDSEEQEHVIPFAR